MYMKMNKIEKRMEHCLFENSNTKVDHVTLDDFVICGADHDFFQSNEDALEQDRHFPKDARFEKKHV